MQHKEESVIFSVIKSSSLSTLRTLLDTKTDLSVKNAANQTLIQYAAAIGNWTIVNLIADKVKTDAEDAAQYGETLCQAIKKEQWETAEILLLANASPNAFSEYRQTALYSALEKKNLKMVELLLKRGADPTLKNAFGINAMRIALWVGFWEGIEAIAKSQRSPATDNGIDQGDYGIALLSAVKKNKFATAGLLLSAGANPDIIDTHPKNHTVDTPLHAAVTQKNIVIIQLLLNNNADLFIKNHEGLTPLQLAINLNAWDSVEALLDKNIQGDDRCINYYSQALKAALKATFKDRAYLSVVKKLLERITQQGSLPRDQTMLHKAVFDDNPELLKLLLQFGADPYELYKGRTAFEYGCDLGHWNCVRVLSKVSGFEFKNKENLNNAFIKCLSYQSRRDNLDIVEYLLKAGADVSCELPGNNTPLHYAISDNDPNTFKLLLAYNPSQLALSLLDNTAVELACRFRRWEFADALISATRDEEKNVHALHYEQALIYAIDNDGFATAELLLKNHAPCGAFKGDKSEGGMHSPLYVAIGAGKANFVQLLLEYGADPRLEDEVSHKTYYKLAEERNDKATLQVLRQHQEKKLHYKPEALVRKIDLISEGLEANDFSAEEIPDKLKDLEDFSLQLFNYELDQLHQLRHKDPKGKLPQTSTEEHLSRQQELEGIDLAILIKTINSIVRYPRNSIPLHDKEEIKLLAEKEIPEAVHVYAYLERKHKIESYIERLRSWLKFTNEHFEKAEFKVSAFGFFIKGTPDHIRDIKKVLHTFKFDFTPSQEVLEMYMRVTEILKSIKPSKHRHRDTEELYKVVTSEESKLSFSDPSRSMIAASVKAKTPEAEAIVPKVAEKDPPVALPEKVQPARLYPNCEELTDWLASRAASMHHYPLDEIPASPIQPEAVSAPLASEVPLAAPVTQVIEKVAVIIPPEPEEQVASVKPAEIILVEDAPTKPLTKVQMEVQRIEKGKHLLSQLSMLKAQTSEPVSENKSEREPNVVIREEKTRVPVLG